jgi:hypothetical protein
MAQSGGINTLSATYVGGWASYPVDFLIGDPEKPLASLGVEEDQTPYEAATRKIR